MNLLRTNYTNLDALDAFDEFFQQAFANVGRLPAYSRAASQTLAADIVENAEGYVAYFELPGFQRDDVKVTVENDVLTVEATRKERDGDEERSSTFRRSMSVPDSVDGQNVSARLEDGLLAVTLPKGEAEKPRQIEVR